MLKLSLAPVFIAVTVAFACTAKSRNIVVDDALGLGGLGGGSGAGGGSGSSGSGATNGSGGATQDCTVDAECSGTTPICVGGVCTACATNADCVGQAGAICGSSGACVECEVGSDCTSQACLDEKCIAEETAIYALAATGSFQADCGSLLKPCRFLDDAVAKLSSTQPNLVLIATTESFDGVTLAMPQTYEVNVYGNGVKISASAPVFTVAGGTLNIWDVIFETAAAATHTVGCTEGGSLGLYRSWISGGAKGVLATECNLSVLGSTFSSISVNAIDVSSCADCESDPSMCSLCAYTAAIQNSTFDGGKSAIYTDAPWTVIQNNLIKNCGVGDYDRCLYLSGYGSFVRFNTILDSGNCSYTGLFSCSADGVTLSSNLTTGSSPNAMTPCYDQVYDISCTMGANLVEHSLSEVLVPGVGNVATTDPRFVDAVNGNYQLAADSPAVNKGNVTDPPEIDFEGNPRAQGTAPDIGAFESAY